MRFWRLLISGALVALLLAATAPAADAPRYDVPPGFKRCPQATAWNGFFKWASTLDASCRYASAFMRAYAREAERGPMPRSLRGFRCQIRYWRNEEREIYASRHRCARRATVVRFYGTV